MNETSNPIHIEGINLSSFLPANGMTRRLRLAPCYAKDLPSDGHKKRISFQFAPSIIFGANMKLGDRVEIFLSDATVVFRKSEIGWALRRYNKHSRRILVAFYREEAGPFPLFDMAREVKVLQCDPSGMITVERPK